MLCRESYPQDYIDDCRGGMASQLAAYKGLIAKAKVKVGKGDSDFESAVERFEALFFSNLVLVLDNYFVHRSRALEGKDGNALNELRLISTSLLLNHGVMSVEKNNKTIKYSPENSIVKLKIGDEIKLTKSTFGALSAAFFAEIENKFGDRHVWRA